MENTATHTNARSNQTTRMLCEGAIMIALSLILGLIKLFELPQGGSISLEMLPLLLFCVRWGVARGFITCTAFGILQVFVQGAVSWGWQSILLDYVVAFAAIGFAGFGRGHKYGIFWGSVLGALGRFVVHFISGITIYRILVPTEVLGTVFDNPYLYSAAYNGSYVAIDLAISLVVFAILYKPLNKYLTGGDLR
ncbi:hypothetical protein CE91St43_00540 [Oscillospiraceae bacterium]|nr:hypothetical protein CE91St43_00540 [Oscillospiraceae bacterium]